ncbi:hypothetical protein ACJIZ3_008573 [Penstemon smallii]|uniref:Uncharacterized protein n=1 Tax=Penstemon smallii TaxID=265156 RepID=A0ABD3TA48_9LAMI
MGKMESYSSERQISVDPISLRQESTKLRSNSFLSCSFPNPGCSSPLFDLTVSPKLKKKSKNHQGRAPVMARQHSVAINNLERLRETHIQRSKSCGEGRLTQPSVDFDLWPPVKNENQEQREEGKVMFHKKGSNIQRESSYEEKFKCGAMCLFLPGFGKGKPVRAPSIREESIREELRPESENKMGRVDIMVSQRVSLEKFECGSWRSSAVINNEDQDGDVASSLFFDLPVELIRCSNVNDTESPVTTAFLFDNNKDHLRQPPKGVLKNTASNVNNNTTSGLPNRKSQDSPNSSRHVRFSTSSPTKCPTSPTSCITPRLRQARDDFNAFLEAQSA